MTTTATPINEIIKEDEYDNEWYLIDENGKQWCSYIQLYEITNLEFDEECEYSDGIKYLIKKHLTENYQYVETDNDENVETLWERLEREYGNYLMDYDCELVFSTMGDYNGEVRDRKRFNEITANKGWEEN